jgi:hypothetical protein
MGPEVKLAPARRKKITHDLAQTAARRLARMRDPMGRY